MNQSTAPDRDRVLQALRSVHDPEIPVNIYDLGLIYGLDISPNGDVHIRMTLTSPACPVAGALPAQVEASVREVPGVQSVRAELVWDPPWTPDRMSEAARLQLNMEGDSPPPKHRQETYSIGRRLTNDPHNRP
jgi:FeS assembly SUF system protein